MKSTLKMLAIYSSETLVLTYQIIWRHIPQDHNQIYPDGGGDMFLRISGTHTVSQP
jgi:hypothetical protein